MDKSIVKICKDQKTEVLPVGISDIHLEGFFAPYIERNRRISIPYLYRLFEKYGTIDNFRIAAGVKKGEITRRLATDSDLYKWIEAVSWDLQNYPNPEMLKLLDGLIKLIAKSQEPEGYLDTYYIGKYKRQRFLVLENSHELYCGGHLIQAAIAHYRSTGKTNLLDVAIKWSDYIFKKFEKKQIQKNDGHPEVEMALVELFRTTDEKKYLELAGILMEKPYYYLGNKKFLEIKEITGHAVRMMYLLCGATDYCIETGDKVYLQVIKRLYEDLHWKYYITGGIGSRYSGEAFGERFELPNFRAYCETCASIALMMWLYRMFLIQQNPEYFDLLETVLYNSFLAAVSLDGKKYFYVNPLASAGNHIRKEWYGTTCCPPNFQRFVASLPGYFIVAGKNKVWINLYDSFHANIKLVSGNIVSIRAETEYPWKGLVKISIKQSGKEKITVYLRIPGWSEKTKIIFEGKAHFPEKSSYFALDISKDAFFEIHFDTKAQFNWCNPAVESNRNCVAITRGPLVYCLEGCDNDFDIFNFFLTQQKLKERLNDSLNGIVSLNGYGFVNKNIHRLYFSGFPCYNFKKVIFEAIPYFTWANRQPSSMTIWLNGYER